MESGLSGFSEDELLDQALEAGAADQVVLIHPVGDQQTHLESHVTDELSGPRFAEQPALDAPGDVIDDLPYRGQSVGFAALSAFFLNPLVQVGALLIVGYLAFLVWKRKNTKAHSQIPASQIREK